MLLYIYLVELITQKGHAPSKGWLKFVKTDSAKSRIKAYFYKTEREKYISTGHEMLLNECKKRNADLNELLTEENIEKLCDHYKLDNLDDIYFSVATLKVLPSTLLSKLDVHVETQEDLKNSTRGGWESIMKCIITN